MNTKTLQPHATDIKHAWHLLDARGQILGRLSTQAATLLMGKNKVNYAPHLDQGDHVVIINAQEIALTGNKEKKKIYWRHSGYPSGMHLTPAQKVRGEHPERLLEHSISGMLPKNKLRDVRLTRLHVVVGPNHPYTRQVTKNV